MATTASFARRLPPGKMVLVRPLPADFHDGFGVLKQQQVTTPWPPDNT
jgi:hypothetical protein